MLNDAHCQCLHHLDRVALCDPPKPRCSIALNMPSASNGTINAPTMTNIFIISNNFATLDRSTSYDTNAP